MEGKFGQLVLLAPIAVAAGAFLVLKWRFTVYILLMAVPYVGWMSIKLNPAKWPLVFKDFAFVIPAYIGFYLIDSKQPKLDAIPNFVSRWILGLIAIVLFQCLNPLVPNSFVFAVGAKIWLLYLPLIYLGSAMLRTPYDLRNILRVITVFGWFPSIFGIYLWYQCGANGYEETMIYYYGPMAAAVTQGFESFYFGGGRTFRIPSTFTYVVQYFNFTISMIAPAYILQYYDNSRLWRIVGFLSFSLAIFASLVSGARAAYMFTPLLLMFIYMLHRGVSGWVRGGFILASLGILAISIAGIDLEALFDTMSGLTSHYGQNIAVGGLQEAFIRHPLGYGTGMNTGAARHVVPDSHALSGIENYYAKALIELGLVGVVIVAGLFISVLVTGYRNHINLKTPYLRVASSGLLAYLAMMSIQSFKGWPLDLDPANIYFWLFIGMMLKLPNLETTLIDNESSQSDDGSPLDRIEST